MNLAEQLLIPKGYTEEMFLTQVSTRETMNELLLAPETVYNVGDCKTFEVNGFKASNAITYNELDMDDFIARYVINDPAEVRNFNGPENYPLGISRNDILTFAINPRLKHWKHTLFHEIGHIELDHGPVYVMLDFIFHDEDRMDYEADTFASIVMNKLGLPTEPEIVAVNARAAWGRKNYWGLEISNSRFKEIEAAAKRFIARGR